MQALKEEIVALSPRAIVFVTGSDYHEDIRIALDQLGFRETESGFLHAKTCVFSNSANQVAIVTRHPERWGRQERDQAIEQIRGYLA